MRRVISRTLIHASIAAVAAVTVAAQAVPQLRLKPADATLAEEFTLIGSVRELSDGRVLISDSREKRIVVADLSTGAVTQVGRIGGGPGEYSTALPLRPMGGDSSIMFDMGSARWHIFDGPGIVRSLPPDAPIVTAFERIASGADGHGHVWKLGAPPPATGVTRIGAGDSAVLLRGNLTSGRLDTLARLRLAVSRLSIDRNQKGEIVSSSIAFAPLTVGEQAVLFRDGWFAIARLDPYRVDWIAPDGATRRGTALPVRPISVTQREKDAYFAGERTRLGAARGPIPANLQRDMDAVRDLFPGEVPPFVSGGLIAAYDGTLLARKHVSADFPDARYDVVNRRGQFLGTIALAKGERIATVGLRGVYVAWKDNDDIERLRRHPWP